MLSRRRRQSLSKVWLLAAAVLTAAFFLLFASFATQGGGGAEEQPFDAVVIPGGGLTASGAPLPWVCARLDAALRHDASTRFYLVLSRGTTHKPPPVDADGHAIDEASASADYLVARGVAKQRVLLERWSLDTIGNAAFCRLFHAELSQWRHLLVITSAVHMPRTKAIFEWIFSLPPLRVARPQLSFEAVPEVDLSEAQRASRDAKEKASLAKLRTGPMVSVQNLADLHAFLFQEHAAYSARAAQGSDMSASRQAEENQKLGGPDEVLKSTY